MQKENPYLLPKHCRPIHYELTLEPEIEQGICHGHEIIQITLAKPARKIKINVNEVIITKATIRQQTAEITYDKKMQTADLTFPNELAKGKETLSLTFESKLREDLRGFYKSTYEVNGTKKVLATTQFEATDARRCFPCFDEPALKATFAVTLIIPKELTAISNMPVKQETVQGQKKKLLFQISPIMSTYLLAFLIGEFEGITKKTSKGTTVGVWTTPGKKHQGQFALGVAVKVLEYYESYFDIPYPLPKADLIAIPDFESGAMENWGAITYRETALLFDEKVSSVAAKERIAIVVAHELAHQWFGNLVTMQWWNDLWLNEGFASWIEYKAVDHLFPEWDMWVQFYTDDQSGAFSLDGLETSHSIEVEVINPAEIDEIFDAVSYNKGASVIRMLEQYLGEETFRKGMKVYLSKFAYANATTSDLWYALAEVSGKPVQRMMDSWTKQTGYPLVIATATESRIDLTQERYFFSGRKKDSTLWNIPIALQQEKEKDYILMEKKTQQIAKKKGLTIINKDQVGFYRIQYNNHLFKEQLLALQQGKLNVLDKIGLTGNSYALAEANYADMIQFLELLQHLREEENYTLWSDIAGSLSQLQMMFVKHKFADDLDTLTRWVFEHILKKINWEEQQGESHRDILLRMLVLATTGFSKEKVVQTEAKKRFDRYLKTKQVNSNLRGVIYSLAAWTGNKETWEQLKKLHQEAKFQEEQVRIFGAMCMFQQKELLQRTLDYSLSAAVRPQDSPGGIARIARNPFGMDLAWEFLRKHWEEYQKRYGAGGHIMGRVIQAVTAGFSTEEQEQEVQAFFKKHPVPHAKRAIEQSLESIQLNRQFIKKHEKTVEAWLNTWKKAL